MAKLRKWVAYRKVERPYTRWSKVRGKAFVKSRPGKKIIKYDMGDLVGGGKQFPLVLRLISKDLAQIRTNALEASRTTALRKLEKRLGRTGFYFKILAVPHQVIRENPLAAGAGADRLSTGMKHSFGKIIGTAARVEKGKVLYELYLPKEYERFGRRVLTLVSQKLPVKTTIDAEFRKEIKLTKEELQRQEDFLNKRRGTQKEADEAAAEEASTDEPSEDSSSSEEEQTKEE